MAVACARSFRPVGPARVRPRLPGRPPRYAARLIGPALPLGRSQSMRRARIPIDLGDDAADVGGKRAELLPAARPVARLGGGFQRARALPDTDRADRPRGALEPVCSGGE